MQQSNQAWSSTKRMKENKYSSEYRFERKQIKGIGYDQEEKLHQQSQNFFKNLQCGLAQKYLGTKKYWKLLYITQGFGDLSFRVEAIDGGQAQVIIAKSVVKFMGVAGGMGHIFEKKNGGRTQECLGCNKKIHIFLLYLKDKIKLPMKWDLQKQVGSLYDK